MKSARTKTRAMAGRAEPERPLVLGIESSCDDTACAVLDGWGRVLSSAISSQIAAHRPYGGVVPEIASREHLANWPRVSARALDEAGCDLEQVDLVAATRGPGLVGSLLVGLSLGKALAYALGRPFHAVHHLEGHLFSPFLAASARDEAVAARPAEPVLEEFIALVVSGGHTSLFSVEKGHATTISETRDDALGECFDKIGKRLGLAFPGGAEVDRLADLAPSAGRAHRFKVPHCGDTLDFSYSGLKTHALTRIAGLERRGLTVDLAACSGEPDEEILELIAGFRRAAIEQLIDRVERLYAERPFRALAVSGGAAANRLLRRRLETWAQGREVDLWLVPLEHSSDNAAMIAFAALLRHRRGESATPFEVDAASRLEMS